MISSTNLISFYFIRDTGRASSQPSGNLSNSFPDGIPVGNLIPLMRREFPMGSHNLLFGYRFLSCSDPKLTLGCDRGGGADDSDVTALPEVVRLVIDSSSLINI